MLSSQTGESSTAPTSAERREVIVRDGSDAALGTVACAERGLAWRPTHIVNVVISARLVDEMVCSAIIKDSTGRGEIVGLRETRNADPEDAVKRPMKSTKLHSGYQEQRETECNGVVERVDGL